MITSHLFRFLRGYMTVRAFFQATKIPNTKPPYDTIHFKVFYPAWISGSEQERNFGIVPADSSQTPFPVVIFFGGFNCGPGMYDWMAVELAQRSLVVVTFAWVSEYLPGMVGLTPGITGAITPTTYGTAPTASALPALLTALDRLQADGMLAGMLNLQQIILGGHSAGGRVALENADPRFFPQVAAAFAYGAHTAAPIMLGFEPNMILPLPGALPLLLMGGTQDGVIAASSERYGMRTGDATRSVVRTFREAIAGGRDDTYLLLLEGANHFSIACMPDPTATVSFLDLPATQPLERIRSLIAETVGLFIDTHVRKKPEAAPLLEQLLNIANPIVASFERK